VFLCLNWAVVTDILFYVIIPTRRSTAEVRRCHRWDVTDEMSQMRCHG
jgi:hypothetical protein